jgi:hypothetical protein
MKLASALVLLAPLTASAQLALFSFNGTTETPVGPTYNFGSVATGSTGTARFRAHNTGNSPITISTITVSGFGFSIAAVNGTLPYPVAPGNFLEFTVQLMTTVPATYNANLQINTISQINLSVILLASAVTPPQLAAVSGCTVSNGAFDFGSVQVGALHLCNFSLFNPTGASMLISNISLTGGFQFQQPGPATPLMLPANQGTMFTVEITPACGTASFSGSLIVNSQVFPLTGGAITPPLPKPAITFDSASFSSGEQHTVALNLPSAPPCAAAGNLNLAFKSTVTGVSGDSSIVFLQGSSPSLPFTVAANSTAVLIAGQPTAMFQTGTTAGMITFTVTGTPLAADPTTSITIPPAVISIDLSTASNQRAGELDLEVAGFDNTYSAGAMSFTFFSTTGAQIGAPVTADFSSAFETYFSTQLAGSSFLMRVSFPIQGNQALVGTVQATLKNAAGDAPTGTLTFQ